MIESAFRTTSMDGPDDVKVPAGGVLPQNWPRDWDWYEGPSNNSTVSQQPPEFDSTSNVKNLIYNTTHSEYMNRQLYKFIQFWVLLFKHNCLKYEFHLCKICSKFVKTLLELQKSS